MQERSIYPRKWDEDDGSVCLERAHCANKRKEQRGVHFCVSFLRCVCVFSFLHIQLACLCGVVFFFARICSTQFSYVSIPRSIYIYCLSQHTHATTEIQGTRGEQKRQNFCVAYQKSVSDEVSLPVVDSKHYNGSGQASSLIREQC